MFIAYYSLTENAKVELKTAQVLESTTQVGFRHDLKLVEIHSELYAVYGDIKLGVVYYTALAHAYEAYNKRKNLHTS